MSLVQQVLEGNRLALARLLTQIENDTPDGRMALQELFPLTGGAHLIGVTGAPGTGKSTLVTHLVRHFRTTADSKAPSVAVIAVDPSSPFSGGAILGDRIRMRDLAGDPGVFIRSMASRGTLGGLSTATSGLVQALDAAGYGAIFIETVGAGQAEVDIARLAHTTLVVEAPGLGDDIQAIKAGILEIADILVINKADRPGVESTERALRGMLQLAHQGLRVANSKYENWYHQMGIHEYDSDEEVLDHQWIPPIQRTIALDGSGVSELQDMIISHYKYLQTSGALNQRERARLRSDLDNLLRERLLERWQQRVSESAYERILVNVVNREISPWEAVENLIEGGYSS